MPNPQFNSCKGRMCLENKNLEERFHFIFSRTPTPLALNGENIGVAGATGIVMSRPPFLSLCDSLDARFP